MKSLRFLLCGCLVFLLLGPPIPLLAIGVHQAIKTGEPGKISAAVSATIYLSVFAYFFGGLIAILVGAAFSAVSLVVVRLSMRFLRGKSVCHLALMGSLLGVVVCLSLGLIPLAQSALSGSLPARASPHTLSRMVSGILSAKSLSFYFLPTMICGAVVWSWLVPRLIANPSVKGTSCGKPQAAPYVER